MGNLPAWYTPEAPTAPPQPKPMTASGTPSWYTPEPTAVAPPAPPVAAPTHPVEAPTGSTLGDAGNFMRTAASNAAAAVWGIPRDIQDAGAWMDKHVANLSTGIPMPLAPESSTIADTIFNHTAPEYQPQTTAGRYGMAGTTGAVAGLATGGEGALAAGANALRGAAANVAAQGATDLHLPAWAGPLVTAAAEFLARKGVAPVVAAHTAEGQDAIAAKIMKEAAPVSSTAPPPAALPGLRLTSGQASGDQNLLALDSARASATPGGTQAATDALTGNQAVIRDKLDTLGNGSEGIDASAQQAGDVNAASAASWKAQQAAWDKVPADTQAINLGTLKSNLDAYVAKATANGDEDLLPSTVIDKIKELPDNAPLASLQARRNRLGGTASQQFASGDRNSGRITSGVQDILSAHLDDPANISATSPGASAAYTDARQATADHYAKFGGGDNQNPIAAKILAPTFADTRTLDVALRPGAGGPEGLSGLKTAVGTGAGLDPARGYLIGKLKDAVANGPDAFNNVLSKYDYAFKDKDLFNPAQQATLKDAQDAITQSYAAAKPGAKVNSATYAGLTGKSFARTLYGNILGAVAPPLVKLAGAGAGEAAASAVGLPGIGEVVGAMSGKEMAEGAMHTGMDGARQKILDIVDKARQNPAAARDLQLKASAGNLKMAKGMKSLLKGLGISEALALPQK